MTAPARPSGAPPSGAPPSGTAPSERTRPPLRPVLAVVGATALVLVVAAVLLLVGYEPLPAFPSLAADPDPAVPGAVAAVLADEREQCVVTVPAGGGDVTELRCRSGEAPVEQVAWTTGDDLAVVTGEADGAAVVVLDGATGEPVDRVETGADVAVEWRDDGLEHDGAVLLAGGADGEALLRVREADGTVRDLVRATGPADYRFSAASWSPDGRWVLVADSRGRLLVVAADGTPGPRVLVGDDATGAMAWAVPGDRTDRATVPGR